jgi:Flp pilus assembly protein TadG
MRLIAPHRALFAPERHQPGPPTQPRSPALQTESAARAAEGPVTLAKLTDCRGQAAVEFALVLPILVTFLFVIFELAVLLTHWMTLNDVASVSARAAAVYRFSGQSCDAVANDAGTSAAGGLPVTVGPCVGAGTPGSTVTVTVTTPWSISLPLLPWSASGDITSTATERVE